MSANFHADGPHSPERSEAAASQVHDLTRFIVYASMAGRARRGLRYPGHLYTILGSLSSAAYLNDQMLTQFAAFLVEEAGAGRIRRDNGGSVSDRVSAAVVELNRAREAAAVLANALANAQAAINDVAAVVER